MRLPWCISTTDSVLTLALDRRSHCYFQAQRGQGHGLRGNSQQGAELGFEPRPPVSRVLTVHSQTHCPCRTRAKPVVTGPLPWGFHSPPWSPLEAESQSPLGDTPRVCNMAAVTDTPSLGTKYPSFLSRPGCPNRGQILTGLEARIITAHHGPGHPPIFVVPQWSGCPPAPAFTDTVPTLAHPLWIARCVSSTQHLLQISVPRGLPALPFGGRSHPTREAPDLPPACGCLGCFPARGWAPSRPRAVLLGLQLPRVCPAWRHSSSTGEHMEARCQLRMAPPLPAHERAVLLVSDTNPGPERVGDLPVASQLIEAEPG